MKLRLTEGEIRLRLSDTELNDYAVLGRIEERVVVADNGGSLFTYALEVADVLEPRASLESGRLTVRLPKDLSRRWTTTDLIGIESDQDTGSAKLRILVEKDLGRRSSRFEERG